MTRTLRALAAAAATTLLLGAIPAQADAQPWDLPIAESGGGPGNGWGAVEFTTDGTRFNLYLTIPNIRHTSQLGYYLYDANDTYRGGFVFTALDDVKVAAREDVGSIPGIAIHEVQEPADFSASGSFGLQILFNADFNNPPTYQATQGLLVGTYKVAFWAVGRDPQPWTWSLQKNPSAAVGFGTPLSGDRAFLALPEDFAQETGVAAEAGYSMTVPTPVGPVFIGASAGARAGANLTRSLDVENHLVGNVLSYASLIGFPFAAGRDEMTISSDVGYSTTCNFCFQTEVTGPGAAGPGTYTWTDTGAAAGVFGYQDFIVVGIDAALP